jgi:hypothetical protein
VARQGQRGLPRNYWTVKPEIVVLCLHQNGICLLTTRKKVISCVQKNLSTVYVPHIIIPAEKINSQEKSRIKIDDRKLSASLINQDNSWWKAPRSHMIKPPPVTALSSDKMALSSDKQRSVCIKIVCIPSCGLWLLYGVSFWLGLAGDCSKLVSHT